MTTTCPGCRTRPKGTGRYLCLSCWSTLPMPTRRELRRRDPQAFARLRSLHTQLDQGVPLTEIAVTVDG
ncbi:hypothetical protein ACFCXC_18200 [Streptomyces microflavus]|uniref:hypothetical protein n=1 Tax=Streptomyces microflavus TaxID=1919 RepID=UPI0035E34656